MILSVTPPGTPPAAPAPAADSCEAMEKLATAEDIAAAVRATGRTARDA